MLSFKYRRDRRVMYLRDEGMVPDSRLWCRLSSVRFERSPRFSGSSPDSLLLWQVKADRLEREAREGGRVPVRV